MAKKNIVEETSQQEDPGNKQIPPEIVKMIIDNYNIMIDQQMELLHNRIAAYVSEAKLPVMQVIMVLQILLGEAVEMATTKYVKGE